MIQKSKHPSTTKKKPRAVPAPASDPPPPIATISGWEDGVPFTRSVTRLDRWELQNADTLTVHLGTLDVRLAQDPHSPHLGGYVWVSSFALCSYFQNLAEEQHSGSGGSRDGDSDTRDPVRLDTSSTWIELGSGVGLMGIVLARLGVGRTIMTDIPELVPQMRANIEANMDSSSAGTVVAEPLVWGDIPAAERLARESPPDHILAVDCIYSEASARGLVETMDTLAHPRTRVLCMSEVRNQAAQDVFMEEARGLFEVVLMPTEAWHGRVAKHIKFDETLNFYVLRKRAG